MHEQVFGVRFADHLAAGRLTWLPVLPVVTTTAGMCLIVAGSTAMLAECRLAAAQIRTGIAGLVAGYTSRR